MFSLLLANSYERDMVTFNEILKKGQRIFGSSKKKEELISDNTWTEKKQKISSIKSATKNSAPSKISGYRQGSTDECKSRPKGVHRKTS